MHLRATSRSPRPIERLKDLRLLANEFPLLLRRQLHHAPSLVRPERSENLSTNPEVRMVHVRALQGRGKVKGQCPEFVRCHGVLRQLTNWPGTTIAILLVTASSDPEYRCP